MSLELLGNIACLSLSMLVFYIVGRTTQSLLNIKKNLPLHLTSAPLLGLSLLALQLWAYGLGHVPWNMFTLLLPWLIPMLIKRKSLLGKFKYDVSVLRSIPAGVRHLDPLSKAFLAVGIFFALAFLLRLLTQPFFSVDVLAFWGMKAKEFYLHESVYISQEFYEGEVAARLMHVDYPPLWPLMIDVMYVLRGQISESLMKGVSFVFMFSGVTSLYVFLRSYKQKFVDTYAMPAAFIVLAAPQFLHFIYDSQYMGYADYGLGMLMLLSGIFLVQSVTSARPNSSWFFAFFFACMVGIFKNEGLAFWGAVGFVLFIKYFSYIRTSHPTVTKAMWPILIALILLIPDILWRRFKHSHNISTDFKIGNLAASGVSLQDRLLEVYQEIALFIKTNPIQRIEVFAAIVAAIATIVTRSKAAFVLLFVLAMQSTAYITSFVFTPFTVHYHVFFSLDRLLAQVLPLIVLLLTVNLIDFKTDKK